MNPGLSLGCNRAFVQDVEVFWMKHDEKILRRKLAEASSTHSLYFYLKFYGIDSNARPEIFGMCRAMRGLKC